MLGMRHPFTRALYEQDGEGHIKVTRSDGSWGLFKPNGQWLNGAVEECDAQMCNWINGPQFRNMRVPDPE